jgi:hypothetical protein
MRSLSSYGYESCSVIAYNIGCYLLLYCSASAYNIG